MPNCISAVEQNSGCSGQLLRFMSVVSETIGTKSTNGLAVQYVHCERLGCSLIMITIVLMNAYMHGSTHSHVLLSQVILCFNYI